MGLSSLLGSSSSKRAAKSKSLSSPSAESVTSNPTSLSESVYITAADDLKPLESEPPDLRELNACLEALAVVFPDVQVEVFRELLSKFDGESRLFVVADALLKNRVEWVKGRWKAPAAQHNPSKPADALIPSNERFRSDDYKAAVRALAKHEFKGLPRSTINAVLAESNYSYLEARKTLVDLSSKSWMFSISNFFSRRKPQFDSDPENHQLIIWKSTGRGSIEPCLKPTDSPELDRELYEQLIAPLKAKRIADQQAEDHRLAIELNSSEAEDAHGTIECACCFADCPFEEFTSCNTEGHMICFRCVQHSISEAIFGQGWQRSIDHQTGMLRCPAVDSQECQGGVAQHHIYRAMLEEKRGAEILHKLEQRLADHSLVSSGLPLVRCPFCPFAEVDDVYLPQGQGELHTSLWAPHHFYNVLFIVLCLCAIPFVLSFLILLAAVCMTAWLFSKYVLEDHLLKQYRLAQERRRRRRRGLKFRCRNPDCCRASCLNCNKEWLDIHICNESALVALRTQVEQAMSMAIKRVCPRCNTSFVKTAGCNKLTCPCGYKMCYVCRKDIGGTGDGPDVGYRHFCEHFRPEGDPKACTQCKKCNLWESENEDHVLQMAKEEAERGWRKAQNRELSSAEKVFLETGMGVQPSSTPTSLERVVLGWKWPTVAELCDYIVELETWFA
ncbi:putative E3 ubiquitin-protein ligase ARI4 [Podospora aff. communis PSN243]|uniref:E3 ubiquitin-protein ligase ARI4 n=1 Tax=Podospora aff. communis PSN243 TaxID=3040156 RepID=A0AAV9GP44_9PEZI|nr:putative E3 ubiquitin-protein ligase ARI4 [Podospora aff. communis PSN243]